MMQVIMKNYKKFSFAIFMISLSIDSVFSQGLIIGRVVDEKSEEGLPGANVQIEKTVLGTSTNLQGAFIVRRIPYGNYDLKVSMIGYRAKTIWNIKVSLGDTTFVFVGLQETPIEIDPVIVTASKWLQEAAKTSAIYFSQLRVIPANFIIF